MRLLLDTHVALWWITDGPKLSRSARAAIDDDAHDVFISVVSIWEIGIKNARPAGLGGGLAMSGEDALAEFKRSGAEMLDICPRHAALAGDLPLHHGDPFDRMLIAQTMAEQMTLMTHDRLMEKYSLSLWWT